MSRISYRPIVKKFKDGNDHYISGELLLELAFERIRENNKVVPTTKVSSLDYKNGAN